MKYFFVCLFIVLFSCNITNDSGKRTRSFKLTEDSTFIGAWGGVLKNYPIFPDNDYHLVFIYTKNNKIYVPELPKYFDSTKDEKKMMDIYVSFLKEPGGEYSWNDRFTVESETQISEYHGVKQCYRYRIDEDNNLIFSKEVFEDYYGKDTLKEEFYKFRPYHFKTIKNPEDK